MTSTPQTEPAARAAPPAAEATPPPRAQAAREPATPAAAEAPPPPVDLPEHPTREEVQAALMAVRPALQACVDGAATVNIRITAVSNGRITGAVVEDDYWSRQPYGGCLARAARTARFPAFSRDRFVVVFPFQL